MYCFINTETAVQSNEDSAILSQQVKQDINVLFLWRRFNQCGMLNQMEAFQCNEKYNGNFSINKTFQSKRFFNLMETFQSVEGFAA